MTCMGIVARPSFTVPGMVRRARALWWVEINGKRRRLIDWLAHYGIMMEAHEAVGPSRPAYRGGQKYKLGVL